jgi:hypothetical protein
MNLQTRIGIAIAVFGVAVGFGVGLLVLYPVTLPKPTEPPAAAQRPTPQGIIIASPDARAAYARRLDQAFVANGLDVSVTSQEAAWARTEDWLYAKWPRLMFWGYFSRPFIYQLLSEAKNVLPVARTAGFAAVQFDRKHMPENKWIFDLTGPELPICDITNEICLKK